MDFKVLDWVFNVKHGIGQVVEVKGNGKFLVRFVSPDQLLIITAFGLLPADPPPPGFSFPRAATKRMPGAKTAPSRRQPPVEFSRYLSSFLSVFPEGFEGSKFEVKERHTKQTAANELNINLSKSRFQTMASASELAAVCKSAKLVVLATNLIFSREKIKWITASKIPEKQAVFAPALGELLYGTAQEHLRFENFVDTISQMDSCKWTVATYFQFLQTNGDKMFMKPAVMKPMADSVSISLEYSATPNWRTYSKLQEVGHEVKTRLKSAGLKPRSGLDVQGFIWSAVRIAEGKYDTAETLKEQKS
jgi:hypothetical protein